MKCFKILLIIIFISGFSAGLYAEAVFLKNGEILEGKIKKDTELSASQFIRQVRLVKSMELLKGFQIKTSLQIQRIFQFITI